MTKKEQLLEHVEELEQVAYDLTTTDDVSQRRDGKLMSELLETIKSIIEENCL